MICHGFIIYEKECSYIILLSFVAGSFPKRLHNEVKAAAIIFITLQIDREGKHLRLIKVFVLAPFSLNSLIFAVVLYTSYKAEIQLKIPFTFNVPFI